MQNNNTSDQHSRRMDSLPIEGEGRGEGLNHELYMRRCIQLARNGLHNAPPNPMVGAVIVAPHPALTPDGLLPIEGEAGRGSSLLIIGEGYHVRCGEGHAEVNAFASVRPEHEHMLGDATIYVSLEPCSHWGKTPPCADLIVSKGVKRCVIGCMDPFAKVQGRGIKRLREAGIEVIVGVLEDECRALNSRFMTYHGQQRPFVTLKWAQSADGYIDGHISTRYTQMVCHKRRAEHQAIMVGRNTYDTDHPSLTTRVWYGTDARRYVVTNGPLPTSPKGEECHADGMPTSQCVADAAFTPVSGSIPDILAQLHADGIQSLLVEGGAHLLQQFIDSGLWDEAYVEQGTEPINGHVAAPTLHNATLTDTRTYFGRTINQYKPKD